MEQLNLLSPRKHYDFLYKEEFIFTDSNVIIYNALFNIYKLSPCVIIYGPVGSGKTHLAHLWKNKKNALLLERVDSKQLVTNSCILENIQNIKDEKELLHSYNNAIENQTSLLLTTNLPVNGLHFTLPDLRSRLLASPLVKLPPLEDKILHVIIAKEFYYRNIRIKEDVINYIFNKVERSYNSIIKVVDYIDKLALTDKKNITVKYLSSIL